MKKIFCLILLITTVFAFGFIAFTQNEQDTAENVVAVELSEEDVQYIAEGCFEAFKKTMDTDKALNHDIKYVSVDFSNLKIIEAGAVIPLLEQYCKDKGYQLLQYSYDELIEKGYGDGWSLTSAVLLSSSDAVLKDGKLSMSMSKYRSALGAIGMQYTLHKNENGEWVFQGGRTWIS